MANTSSRGKLLFILAPLLALAGCGYDRDRDDPTAHENQSAALTDVAPASDEAFERSWQGVLPCSDCDGIQTRLVLRRDAEGSQAFEIEETYLGAEAGNVFTHAGIWRQASQGIDDGTATVFRVDPDGADQWFQLQPDGSLELLGRQGQPRADRIGYRLQRI